MRKFPENFQSRDQSLVKTLKLLFNHENHKAWDPAKRQCNMGNEGHGDRQGSNATWEVKGMGTGRTAMQHGRNKGYKTLQSRNTPWRKKKKKAITGQSAKNKQWSTLWDFNMTPFGAQGISQTMGGKVTRARGLGDKRQQAVFCSGQGCRRHTLTTSCAYLHRVQQSTFHRGWGGIHETPILQVVCCAN